MLSSVITMTACRSPGEVNFPGKGKLVKVLIHLSPSHTQIRYEGIDFSP